MDTTVMEQGSIPAVPMGYIEYTGNQPNLQNRRHNMKKIMFRFISAIAIAGAITACGQDTKEAAKETARSAGKLAVTAVSEAAAGAVDVAAEAAKGTAAAATEEAVKAKDKVVAAAKEGVDSVKSKASNTIKEVKGE